MSNHLRAIISAVDRLTPVLNVQMRTINRWRRQFEAAGRSGKAMGIGLAAGMALQMRAFSEAEDAQVGLQNALMLKDGASPGLEKISKLALELGNLLPGTTADFYNMASQLKGLGVAPETIINGALKATAYLAVVGEKAGVTYESAAESVGKLGNALGIADNDLVGFADSLQRTLNIGVNLSEMQYAMAKISPTLKNLKLQGLSVANTLTPLNALLIRNGLAGETAGTGLQKVIDSYVQAGKFKGLEAMIKNLEKYQALSAQERGQRFNKLFGEEGARVANIISAGGYDKIVKDMQEQASLQQKINNSLGTMGNLWGALTGTFENLMAAIGSAYSGEIKGLITQLNDVSGKMIGWAEAHKPWISAAVKSAGLLVGFKLMLLGVAAAMRLLNVAMAANPFLAIAGAFVTLLPFAWEFGKVLGSWAADVIPKLGEQWQRLTDGMEQAWRGVMAYIEPSLNFLSGIFDSLSSTFSGLVARLPKLQLPQTPGMRPPEYQPNSNRPSILQGPRVSGAIDVNFNNAPPGMRVVPVPSRSPVAVNPNVGYRTLGAGGY